MAKPGKKLAALCVVFGLALTAGCTGDKQDASKATTTTTTTTAMDAGDVLACSSVQTILKRMAAGTTHWSTTFHPFDAKISKTILDFANELDIQGNTATSDVIQNQVHSTALAFFDLTTAMSQRDRTQFDAALSQTRVQYTALKKICT